MTESERRYFEEGLIIGMTMDLTVILNNETETNSLDERSDNHE